MYYYGAAGEYYAQFYLPYEHYEAPIFAVPGNHDGDVDRANPVKSLEAFMRNFCAREPVITPDAGESTRTAMTQPHVFWTLETPMATIVGLYTNVPEGGEIEQDQIEWFANELVTAPSDKPLFVTMHHPIISADNHHSGSICMKEALDKALELFNTHKEPEKGRYPDIIFAGHVHNYQRFAKHEDQREMPYIVAGAGGYYHLHSVAKVGPEHLKPVPPVFLEEYNVTFEHYVDDRHGFLRVEVTQQKVRGIYYTVPRPQESWSAGARPTDIFELDWHQHKLRTRQF